MLVWDEPEGLNTHKGYLCAVTRIIVESSKQHANLSITMFAVMKAIARRSRPVSGKPLTATPDRAIGRAKAFFVAQKVNGRNAP